MDLNTKFLGKLNGIDIGIINDELVTYLLDNGVFENSTNVSIREKDSIRLDTNFYFNDNYYSLTDDFIRELYNIFKFLQTIFLTNS